MGVEGMLGIGVFLGDRSGAGRMFQQVPDGPFPSMTARRFVKESATPGPFHDVLALCAGQPPADHARHGVQRAARREAAVLPMAAADSGSRRLERVPLEAGVLAIMLGVQRPTVTLVMGTLRDDGLIGIRYGRIRVLKRKRLEQTACECYEVVRAHFQRLGL